MVEELGIAAANVERARRYAARYPHLARRIMGQRPVYKPAEPAPKPQPRPLVVRRQVDPPEKDTWKTPEIMAAMLASEFSTIPTDPPRVGEIMRVVAEAASISMDEMRAKARPRKVARPRQVAMLITKELRDDLSWPKIGFLFNNVDHTSVYYALKVIPDRLVTDPWLSDIYHRAKAALTQHKEAA